MQAHFNGTKSAKSKKKDWGKPVIDFQTRKTQ
jgi:hypothetical protein